MEAKKTSNKISFITLLIWLFTFQSVTDWSIAQEIQKNESIVADEPNAPALYYKMIETLRKAETLYYESEYQRELGGKRKSHCTYRFWAKKPNYAKFESSSIDRKFKSVLLLDGEHFWFFWPNKLYGRPRFSGEDNDEFKRTRFNSYIKKTAPLRKHSIAHQTQLLGTGISMPVINPSIFHKCTDSMEGYLDGIRSLGRETIKNEECSIIEVSYMNHQRIRCLWISNSDFLPRKLTELIRVDSTPRKIEIWSNIRINKDIPNNVFCWKPPPGWVEYTLPKLEDGLLEPGCKAPDFHLFLTNGNKFKLSDFQGKCVLIVFWRVGCPPCREGLPQLDIIFKKYKSAGFIVLGFNCADEKKIALKFLQDLSITFPNIVDSSEPAENVFFTKYQTAGMSAVPLNYLIDKNGLVSDRWYGFENESNVIARIDRLLELRSELKP
ncbi:MAG TPA: TlpA disulfide reductase family protein [Sedimentisphaerales bacterium]|nr:TlpA disulfide reductase family protein [Sedimentisphaerales bacterium]